MKIVYLISWFFIGLVGLATVGAYWQATRMEEGEKGGQAHHSEIATQQDLDLGIFTIQKMRKGKVVRQEILRIKVAVNKDKKVKNLDKLSPRLREKLFTSLQKRLAKAKVDGPAFNSPKLKKKVLKIAKKILGKDVVQGVEVIDQKDLGELMGTHKETKSVLFSKF